MAFVSVTLDSIIYSLQTFGGASVYWKQLTKRLQNSSAIEYKELLGTRYGRFSNPKINTQILHSSHFRTSDTRGVKNVVTIYDLTYEKGLAGNGISAKINIFQRKKAIMNADAIICISDSTKADLLSIYPNQATSKPIKTIHLATDSSIFSFDNNHKTRIAELEKSILFVGGRGHYKNFLNAILGFHESGLNKSGYRLLCTGQPLNASERNVINNLGLTNAVFSLGHLSESQLAKYYKNSFCLLYPSLYEGFGIPIIEAMSCGCPVIISNTPASLEIGGLSALTCNGLDATSISDSLKQMTLVHVRNDWIQKGLVRSHDFSWSYCAQRHQDTYLEI